MLSGSHFCAVGGHWSKRCRVMPNDMHARLPLQRHKSEKLLCWCSKCRCKCYKRFPPMVREIERGLNPERVNALEEDLKTPRDVLEELVKSLGITVQRKSRRLSQPADSSFHNASNMKVHTLAQELQALVGDITSSLRQPNSKKIDASTPARSMRRAKNMLREHLALFAEEDEVECLIWCSVCWRC